MARKNEEREETVLRRDDNKFCLLDKPMRKDNTPYRLLLITQVNVERGRRTI